MNAINETKTTKQIALKSAEPHCIQEDMIEIRLTTTSRNDGRTISAGSWNARHGQHGIVITVPDVAAIDDLMDALQQARDRATMK